MPAESAETSIFGSVTTGRPATSGGKSHSCETPTSCSLRPSAQTISVALGSKETIFMAGSGRSASLHVPALGRRCVRFDLVSANRRATGAQILELVSLRENQQQPLAHRHRFPTLRAEEQRRF